MLLNYRPVIIAQVNQRYIPAGHVLLVTHGLIAREQDIETSGFRGIKELSVFQSSQSQFVGKKNVMS